LTDHTLHPHPANLGHHFDTLDQQHGANVFGMWVFLVTEVMLFGGLFTAYFIYRAAYSQAFVEGSQHHDILLGGINTAILIVSSLMMALAVRAAQTSNRRALVLFIALTMLFGTVFLGIKGVEYYEAFQTHQVPGALFRYEGEHPEIARQVEMFTLIYFAMTGTHAVHMLIGLGIMTFLLFRSWRGAYNAEYYTPIELGGLYWHFIDIVWVFLFPLLYLYGRHFPVGH
jgi:cytochrome c oxidase subunit III